jgi:hypothetical protein
MAGSRPRWVRVLLRSTRPEAAAEAASSLGTGVVVAVAGLGGGEPPVGPRSLRGFPNLVGLFVPAETEPGFRL